MTEVRGHPEASDAEPLATGRVAETPPGAPPGAPPGPGAAAPARGEAAAPEPVREPPPGLWWSSHSTLWTEYAQDIVTSAVGITLIALAAAILVASVVDFFSSARHLGLTLDATDFLDKVLLVLILVEIVHTVVLSLRAHSLSPEPFIVVGLVAVIRKVLFALGSQQHISTTTLAMYIGMVAVFVASLVAIEWFGGRHRSGAGEEVPEAS